MATNHTTNYHLNTWEPGDSFLRSEFNENFNKLDTALKAVDTKVTTETNARTAAVNVLTLAVGQKADTSALNALSQTVSGKAEIILGTYDGDDTQNRQIELGRKPKAVFVVCQTGEFCRESFHFGGLAFQGVPMQLKGHPGIALTETGFTVTYYTVDGNRQLYTNVSGFSYLYIAFV